MMKYDPNLLEKIDNAILVILILGLAAVDIYVVVKYGNIPVSDMLTSVWRLLKGGNVG